MGRAAQLHQELPEPIFRLNTGYQVPVEKLAKVLNCSEAPAEITRELKKIVDYGLTRYGVRNDRTRAEFCNALDYSPSDPRRTLPALNVGLAAWRLPSDSILLLPKDVWILPADVTVQAEADIGRLLDNVLTLRAEVEACIPLCTRYTPEQFDKIVKVGDSLACFTYGGQERKDQWSVLKRQLAIAAKVGEEKVYITRSDKEIIILVVNSIIDRQKSVTNHPSKTSGGEISLERISKMKSLLQEKNPVLPDSDLLAEQGLVWNYSLSRKCWAPKSMADTRKNSNLFGESRKYLKFIEETPACQSSPAKLAFIQELKKIWLKHDKPARLGPQCEALIRFLDELKKG
jgi:hypothetical protein